MDLKKYRAKLSKGQKKLLSAVEAGKLAEVKKLVQETQLLNTDESFGYILLVTALQREHKTISKFLIKLVSVVKAPVKIKSFCTPLYYAVKMKDQEIFTALLKKGASIIDRNDNEDTALELAMLENKAILEFLLEDIKLPNNSKNLRPDCQKDIALFHAACWIGDSEAVEIFLSHNFSAKSRSIFGRDEWKGFTPLHFIFSSNSWSIIDALRTILKHEADIYDTDERSRTCLHVGIRNREFNFIIKRGFMLQFMTRPNENQFINPVDKDGLSIFHILCSMESDDEDSSDDSEHVGFIKCFIENGVDVNSSVSLQDEKFSGFTALHFAAEAISFEVIKLLIEHGADPSKAAKNGLTPLHLVCRSAAAISFTDESEDERKNALRLKIVKLFLQHGADPFAKDSEGRTPLHYTFCKFAIVRPLDEFEKLLLSANQQGINYTDEDGVSYLHMACMEGDLSLVEALVANGAPINASILPTSKHYCGYTPLHFAAGSNCLEIVKFLLARGADVNAVDDADNTPLHFACDHGNTVQVYGSHKKYEKNGDDVDWLPTRRNHLEIVQLLIDHGADVDAENDSGLTPLVNNCEMPFILHGCHFWYENQFWVDSLQNELLYRQQKIMKILLAHGADINTNSSGGSILHLLAREFNKCHTNDDLAATALKNGADPDAVEESSGSTPLHIAVDEAIDRSHGTTMIDVLLTHGANVNAKDKTGKTPLDIALDRSYEYEMMVSDDVLRSLLNHPGVDVNAPDSCGETPLLAAINRHCLTFIKKLLDSGADINLEDEFGQPATHHLLTYLDGRSNTLSKNDTIILTTVIGHVKKLMKLNEYVSDMVINHCDVLSQHPSLKSVADSIDTEIDKEVQDLKSQELNCHTSLYDILSKDVNAMAQYAQNGNLRAAIQSRDNLKSYKHFGYMIRRQYAKGVKRFKIMEQAKKALNFVTKKDWPNSCSVKILENLCDMDLRKLILSLPEDRIQM